MAFGQQAGPPATAREVQKLLSLIQAAGYTDFRDARGPLGFTQRQGSGKFTRDEAAALIDRMQDETSSEGGVPPTAERATRASAAAKALAHVSTEELAAELQRRGWIVLEP
jgi:hypothetical protein